MENIYGSPAYQKALEKLLNRTSNPKLGLDRINDLLKATGFKAGQFKTVQIVGTNGKGSTAAFTESIVLAHGISCALFTSPHLSSARERIRINGLQVSEADFILATEEILVKATQLGDEASFFECILAMFMWLAAKAQVEVVIVEAGLGGRLDATTAIGAQVLGVSMIDFDHQNILGDTMEAIAREKILAAQPGQKVISVPQHPSADTVIREIKNTLGFELTQSKPASWPLGLQGEHQKHNAGLAIALVEALGLRMIPDRIKQGLLKVRWAGRYELVMKKGIKIIFDGAHNPSGINALSKALKADPSIKNQPLLLVYGSLTGATTQEKISLLTEKNDFHHIFVHMSQNPRAERLENLECLFIEQGVDPEKLSNFSSWDEVIESAQESHSVVLVCGSLYTVGELRGQLLEIASDHLIPNF
jgi:dihydrofolate synthase/folylpolyglutamate synthase